MALSTHAATAEVNIYDSVEWFCARSEIVAIGTLTAVSPEDPSGQDGKSVDLVSLTMQPTRLVKGGASTSGALAPLHFSVRLPDTRRLLQWVKARTEVLVFLRRTVQAYRKDGIEYSLWPVRETGTGEQALVELAHPHVHLISAGEMVHVATAEQLEAACRRTGAAVKDGVEPPGPHLLEVPASSPVFQTLYSGSACYLNVPVGPFSRAKPSL